MSEVGCAPRPAIQVRGRAIKLPFGWKLNVADDDDNGDDDNDDDDDDEDDPSITHPPTHPPTQTNQIRFRLGKKSNSFPIGV